MCYDRTSIGKRPMCATVCPSQALTYAPLEEVRRTRTGTPINEWTFGGENVRTRVYVMVPPETPRVNVELIQIDGVEEGAAPGALNARLPQADDAYDVAVLLGL
jgi:Fe-S-cluster-containing dehydrogenase component